MKKRIKLSWMELLRKCLKNKGISVNDEVFKVIHPLYSYGLNEEERINKEFEEIINDM